MSDTHPALDRIATLGSLLGIKTAPVVARVKLLGAGSGPLVATITHRFNAMSITANVPRAIAASACPWLEPLVGDRIGLELGAVITVAHSDEAALPADAPALVHTFGDDVASVSWDGEAWTYALEQQNSDDAAVEATIARVQAAAEALGVTPAQRKIAAGLHRSLARELTSRVWLRARGGQVDPVIGLSWDRVEWRPVQHMMAGFYPEIDAEAKIMRIARNLGVETATVELVLGPVDPPGMRILITLG